LLHFHYIPYSIQPFTLAFQYGSADSHASGPASVALIFSCGSFLRGLRYRHINITTSTAKNTEAIFELHLSPSVTLFVLARINWNARVGGRSKRRPYGFAQVDGRAQQAAPLRGKG